MDVCENRKIRVASVNQHGTRGYSNPIIRTNFPQPKVQLLDNSFGATFDGYYFYINATWTTPLDWDERDIQEYVINPQVAKYCEHTTLPPVPIVERRDKFSADIRIFISGFGCLYYFNVTAISRCGVKGIPAVFSVKLECRSIDGFDCPTERPKQPPQVQNLTVTTLSGYNNVRVSWRLPLWNESRPDYYFLIWGPSENFIALDDVENTKLMNDTNLTDVFETEIHVHNITQLYLLGVAPRIGKVIKDPADLRDSAIAFANFLVGESVATDTPNTTNTKGILIGVLLGTAATICIAITIGLTVVRKKLREKQRKRSNFSPNPFYYKCNETSDSPKPDAWEVNRNDLQISEILGEGNFGQVVKATLKGREKPVAVKMLLEYSSVHRPDFLREIQVMKQVGEHENIINMLGCITTSEPPCLIVEHMPKGDLYHYLQNAKTENNLINVDKLLNFSIQIATAMSFLSSKGFVHRDLAARNILLDEGDKIKVGDFGLARFIQDDRIYVCRKGAKLPVKWMAIESIFDLSFSSQSDIWSFGIVLYELITHGSTPYPSFSNEELLPCLKAGYRMPKPTECPEKLYQLMIQCWNAIPNRRPSFDKLKNDLEEMLS
ncbi:DgyrCDS2888 [Dimorphilus gyrociliatus]|nr:DgyrCDS2888 [Dimorphilus gyrociliatus]